jgi:cyclopropane-fatty-acyl-phospholipid synthase
MKRDDLNLPTAGADAAGVDPAQARAPRREPEPPPRLSLEGRLLEGLLVSLGNPPIRFALWNGESVCTSTDRPVATLRISNRATLLRLVLNPELNFGEGYSEGAIEVEGDLVRLLETIYRGLARPSYARGHRHLVKWLHTARPNTPSASRDNIHHHYDLGNAFYELWLDAQMLYTCAYFPAPDATLEQAQVAKMDHVARKLRLRAGETVVEAGCGWGALALHLATHYGVKVRAFNISREQIGYARGRARALGAADGVEFVEDDYRNIGGRYDAFVSVGMLEHVGVEHYAELSQVIDRTLGPNGRGLIHSIGQNRSAKLNPWIEKRIFPGAYPPTLREMTAIFEPAEFSVLDVENLRLHYALTLEHWLRRFEAARDRVRDLYGDVFVRTWRLYLAGSVAAFTTGKLQLFQVLFARGASNDVPWTRAHLYE